ncbi:ras-related protein Rab-1B-like [Littorina saxatilis]|uniref:ras-related protein Rab-1B-like n=1 Tax=Littorina saxatilis TaxID=31220 RepID=UPI0038B6A9FE
MVQPQGAEEEPPQSSDSPPSQSKNAFTFNKDIVPPKKPPPSKGYAHLFKYVVVGDSGSGKTALVRRYSKDEFVLTRDYTIGVDFDIKTVPISNGDEVKLQIWDTAGQERYRTITTSYYRGAQGIIIVYDVNNQGSYFNIKQWMQEVRRYCNDDCKIVIVGSKSDLQTEGAEVWGKDKVKLLLDLDEDSEDWESVGVTGYFMVSAKTGEGVEEVFECLTQALVTERLNARNPLRAGGTIKLGKGKAGGAEEKTKKKGCC